MLNSFLILLSCIIFTCALFTILSKNPVHSILFLILVFVNSTILLIILNVEFIAMLFLVVYIGAITVLFLFVVMMLNVKIVEIDEKIIRYIPIGLIIGLIFIFEIIFLLSKNFLPSNLNSYAYLLDSTINKLIQEEIFQQYNMFEITINTNIQQLANALFLKYNYVFILAGILLFIAMFGAIVLTLNPQFRVKRQEYYKQNLKQVNLAIRYLK